MLGRSNIESIRETLKTEGIKITEREIAYIALCDVIADKSLIREILYADDKMPTTRVFEALAPQVKPFGIGAAENISKDENREALIKLLKEIDEIGMEAKDAIKLKADIRLKLQTKFEIEEGEKQKRLIVVPQKHDTICKYTNRECSAMPSKEACMKYYNLKDSNE